MSKLNIEQKSIELLFTERKPHFLIPDYQRPYAWGEDECQTLWDDIFTFAIPDGDATKFDSDSDEYFLGPIVTFKNKQGKLEIIDGQQRLTTLMLLLRAFYSKFGYMMGKDEVKTAERLAKCLWQTDEVGNPDKEKLKIDSEVATDDDKAEFLEILRTGEATREMNSRYAKNYRFFQDKIEEFLARYVQYFIYLPLRIMNNCILLPIEAESQETALRIFSTLNDRGLPLSDSDIFKAQLYKYYSDNGAHDDFIERWKKLDELCGEIFHSSSGVPMDELFTRYMYFLRAKLGIRTSTTEALRSFYEKDNYAILKNTKTFDNLEKLANFWNDVFNQDTDAFSDRVLRKLFVLNYAPNGMWCYLVSVYFMQNKDEGGKLDDEKFYCFLDRITAFIWAYAVTNPGVNALRTPAFSEMINIVNDKDVLFADFLFDFGSTKKSIENFKYYNNRPITKSMLAWWAYKNPRQKLMSITNVYEIEHIYPKKRQEVQGGLSSDEYLELLGNKAILEKRINIRASDYRLSDKKRYYDGYENNRGKKQGTEIVELKEIADKNSDFTEEDVLGRNNTIIDSFMSYLSEMGLVK